MYNKKISFIVRLIAVVLVISLYSSVSVGAAVIDDTVQPMASLYLDSYCAYVYPAGSGKVQVWFTVTGTDYMDELGALRIQLYESTNNSTWSLKATHTIDSTPSLLGYDVIYHSGHIDYQGVAGRYYKAYVCIWGGENGDGDTRYFWTSVKKAT